MLGLWWIGPFLGVAMIGPVAFVIHRYIELPFLGLRPRLERSSGTRIFLSVLQTAPIVAGLALLFPWRDLLGKFPQHPGLFAVVGVAGLGVAAAAGVRAGRRWALAGLDELTALGGVVQQRTLSWAVPVLNVVHRGLRRSAPFLTFLAATVFLVVVAVALTGGFRWRLGPVLLSVRKLERPMMFLLAALALRLVAAISPRPVIATEPVNDAGPASP
jgi:hypothetical protein